MIASEQIMVISIHYQRSHKPNWRQTYREPVQCHGRVHKINTQLIRFSKCILFWICLCDFQMISLDVLHTSFLLVLVMRWSVGMKSSVVSAPSYSQQMLINTHRPRPWPISAEVFCVIPVYEQGHDQNNHCFSLLMCTPCLFLLILILIKPWHQMGRFAHIKAVAWLLLFSSCTL